MKPKAILLSGGGLNGILHLGALQYLFEQNLLDEVTHWAGTSVGAVISLLIILNYTPHQIFQIASKFEYSELRSIDLLQITTTTFGLDTTKRLRQFLASLFPKELDPATTTFKTLQDVTKKTLSITATPITYPPPLLPTLDIFSPSTTPDLNVIDGIMASVALPLIFASPLIRETRYVDGGLIDNFPITQLFPEADPTLWGFQITPPTPPKESQAPTTIDQFVYSLLITVHRRPTLSTSSSPARIIKLAPPVFETLQPVLIAATPEQKLTLFLEGYEQMQKN